MKIPKCPYCKTEDESNLAAEGNIEDTPTGSGIKADVVQNYYCHNCQKVFRIHYRLAYVKTEKGVGY